MTKRMKRVFAFFERIWNLMKSLLTYLKEVSY